MANIGSIKRFFLDSVNYIQYLFVATALCLIVLVSGPSQCLAETSVMSTESTVEITDAIDESADIATEKIDQFSQAYLQVLQLLSDRESEIPAAETNAEALKIEQSIEADAIAIIESSGLTMPEYMEILGLASQDETFQDKVLGRMDDTQEDT